MSSRGKRVADESAESKEKVLDKASVECYNEAPPTASGLYLVN